jgi:type IV secretory pathway TraG/TraD family ATPase VirD4
VAVIVLGSIVATQVLANSYRFHPALGFNLFHIYPPWSYFVWAHQWEQANNHTLFAQAFGLGSLVTIGGFFVLILDVARRNFRVNPYLHGSARWAGLSDIKAAGPDETITSNCHVQVAFPPNRLETAEHLSKVTGQTTIIKEQVTRSGRGLGTQVSTTMQEVQRPLLTPDECLRMPGPQKDEHDRITVAGDMVVYCAGFPALNGRQPLYFEDQTFVARAAIPPPKHSDSLSNLPAPKVEIL